MRTALACSAILVALLSPSAARTEILDDPPPPAGGCTQGQTWSVVTACLAKARYKISPLREGTDWKLVELEGQTDPPPRRSLDAERLIALYVTSAKTWVLGGLVHVSGSHYELLAMTQVKIGKRDAWKLELGQALTTNLPTNDSGASTPALVRYNRTAYCNGTATICSDVYTACEVLVRGRAWYAFRATTVVERDGVLEIGGDRSRGGSWCRMQERVRVYAP
jgi:hypothetical protein